MTSQVHPIEPPKTERDLGPDFVKGVAIVLMLYGHVTFLGTTADAQKALVSCIYLFHMPLFLVISGYYFFPKGPLLDVLKKLCRRLVIPYVIFQAIYLILLHQAYQHGFQTNNSLPKLDGQILAATLLLHPVGGYWFLHTLVIYQACLLLVLGVFRDRIRGIFALVALIFALVQWGGLSFSYTNGAFLLFGYFLRVARFDLPKEVWLSTVAVVLLLLGLSEPQIRESFPLRFSLVFAVLALLLGICRAPVLRLPVLIFSFLGVNSLLILVFHAFALNLAKFAQRPLLQWDSTGIGYAIFSVGCAIGLSIVAGWVIDRLRLSPWIFGVRQCVRGVSGAANA